MSNGKQKRAVKPVGLQDRQTFNKVKYQAAGDSMPDVQKLVKRGCVSRWVPVQAEGQAS